MTDVTNNGLNAPGILSCDIGLKHMVFCFNESPEKPYEIFTFDIQREQIQEVLGQLYQHIKSIIEMIGKDRIKLMVVEGQLQNTLNIQVMYAICMVFTVEGIQYQIQPARSKYSVYKDSVDQNNFKVHGAQDVSNRHLKVKNDIVIRYNKLQRFKFQNHRWYAQYPEMYQFLQTNKIEKFDDIADTVLIIEEYRREQQQILEKQANKGKRRGKQQKIIVPSPIYNVHQPETTDMFKVNDDNNESDIEEELKQLLRSSND